MMCLYVQCVCPVCVCGSEDHQNRFTLNPLHPKRVHKWPLIDLCCVWGFVRRKERLLQRKRVSDGFDRVEKNEINSQQIGDNFGRILRSLFSPTGHLNPTNNHMWCAQTRGVIGSYSDPHQSWLTNDNSTKIYTRRNCSAIETPFWRCAFLVESVSVYFGQRSSLPLILRSTQSQTSDVARMHGVGGIGGLQLFAFAEAWPPSVASLCRCLSFLSLSFYGE